MARKKAAPPPKELSEVAERLREEVERLNREVQELRRVPPARGPRHVPSPWRSPVVPEYPPHHWDVTA